MTRRQPPPAALHASPDDVEAELYEALQKGDIARLMAIWADDEEIVCVHPGGGRLVGAPAIRASFEAIFAQGTVPVRPEQVHRLQTLTTAVHHLVEHLRVEGPEGVQEAWALATNVYLKTAQGWRLVAHHASVADPEDLGGGGEAPATLH